jgi:hypothetical protein
MKPDGFADAPPDPIAHHGFAERAGDCKADPRSIRLRLADGERREQRTGILPALIVDSAEMLGAQQTDTFRKSRDSVLPLRTDGEFFPATGAAACKHGAAVFRFHPGAETVCLRAMTVVGLKGAFRHDDYK